MHHFFLHSLIFIWLFYLLGGGVLPPKKGKVGSGHGGSPGICGNLGSLGNGGKNGMFGKDGGGGLSEL